MAVIILSLSFRARSTRSLQQRRIFRLESLKGIKQKSHLLNRKAIASALIDSNAFFLSLFIQKIFPEELERNLLM
jgi:hypothetical protein